MITIYTSAGCVSPELDMKSEMKKARQSGKLCLSASNPDGRQMDLLFKYYDPKILDPEEKWWDTSPLTYIDLSSNSLRMLDMRISVFAKNLSVLNLRDNEISELPSGLFELTELTKLDLSHNLLKEIPRSISKLSNLVDLNLSFNQLEQVDNNLCMLRALQVLQIDQNRLLNLPTDVGLLQSLTSFSCARNSISELPDTFGKLANLKELDLSYNCLNELPRSFKNLLKLTILNLSFNRIVSLENLPKDEGDANAKLQRFMASDNLISTLEGLEDLSDIVHVNLRSNRVTHIDFDLRKLSKLSVIILSLCNNLNYQIPHFFNF